MSGLELWDRGRALAAEAIDAAMTGNVEGMLTGEIDFVRVLIQARLYGISERARLRAARGNP